MANEVTTTEDDSQEFFQEVSLKNQKMLLQAMQKIARMLDEQKASDTEIKNLFVKAMQDTSSGIGELCRLLSVPKETGIDNSEIVGAITKMNEQVTGSLLQIKDCMEAEEAPEEKGEWVFSISRGGNNLISSVRAKRQ